MTSGCEGKVGLIEFTGAALPLSVAGLEGTLDRLEVGAAELWAMLTVETSGCGFLPDRRPVILFERHVFHRQTSGAHDRMHPAISAPEPGGYLGGAPEYGRLAEALALDRTAALKSTSWGIGQIMGYNAPSAGFASAGDMVAAMANREDQQLLATANFLRARRLHLALAAHDWTTFAREYNGPDFARNQYDARLAAAYRRFKDGPLPDLEIRSAQMLLMFLDIDPGAIDGIPGKRTRSAVMRFREQRGLPVSDRVDGELIAALLTSVGTTVSGANA